MTLILCGGRKKVFEFDLLKYDLVLSLTTNLQSAHYNLRTLSQGGNLNFGLNFVIEAVYARPW